MKVKIAIFAGLTFALACLIAHPAYAQGKISGYLFGDYYWFINNHDSIYEGQNGLWVRRVYFTYDKDMDERFTSRLRLEVNQDDFTKPASQMKPSIKDAYLQWKLGLHSAFLGISSTPSFDLIEENWGYRSVEKTPQDLQKLASSRDVGFAVKGHLDKKKILGYHLMGGNGSGTNNETNKNKKFYLSLSVKPGQGLIFEVYGDYENNKDNKPNTSTYILQAFAGVKKERGRAGILFTQNIQEQGKGQKDQKIELASAYSVLKLTDKISTFARIDHLFNTNPDASKISYIPMVATARSTLGILGLDFKAGESVSFMPNVEVVTYSHETTGTKPGEDIIARLTVYYKF